MKKIKEIINTNKFKRGMEIFLRVGGVILTVELIAVLLGVIEITKLSFTLSQLIIIWIAFGSTVNKDTIEE